MIAAPSLPEGAFSSFYRFDLVHIGAGNFRSWHLVMRIAHEGQVFTEFLTLDKARRLAQSLALAIQGLEAKQ